jgi:voltage-gated potassium channel
MRNLWSTVMLLVLLMLIGVIGFRLTTQESWFDCLYLSVITLTTVGSKDPGVDVPSKLFVICYLIAGLGIFTYGAFQVGSWVVSAEFRRYLEKRRMQKRISQLSGHAIVCGQGRMGFTICEYLADRKHPFVVIDRDEERTVALSEERRWPYVIGDATDDDTLQEAGIERATSLTTTLKTDSDNLYVVVSARLLNATLKVIARASDEKAVVKLKKAGASRVVSPFRTGAVRMARFMLNPSIEDFLEIADEKGNELELAEVQITSGNPYIGKQLLETNLRESGVMVIGISRASGEQLMPPAGDAVIHVDDSLFVFGKVDAVQKALVEPQED